MPDLFQELSGLMTAFGASGIATAITTFLTGRKSGVKKQVESEKQVDVARQHLVDEVHWLREQLLMKQMKDE
jgi:hypothetical protein